MTAEHGSESMTASGTLYLVSTPIGNLADLTRRAEEVLRASDLLLAEDTRRTRVLLEHYGIRPGDLRSFHKHNEAARTEEVRVLLREGGRVALVSDSGTPLISDPGLRLVEAAIDAGAAVVPVPGPSALLAALVASGLDPEPFSYFGFPPRSGRRRGELFEELARLRHTAVLFESPQRLVRTLEELGAALGSDRRVAVARELTKRYEELRRGTLKEVAAYYRENPPRGEVVLCIAGASRPAPEDSEPEARELATELARDGVTTKDIVRALRQRFGWERNRAYDLAIEVSEEVSA